MAALDLRVPFTVCQEAFGLSATVRRPEPDEDPITTVVVWLTDQSLLVPQGMRIGRREPQRIICISRADVPTVPRNTVIESAEVDGEDVQSWRVDGLEAEEYDHVRARVIPVG